MTTITLIGTKDHPLGGFRLWQKGDLFRAEAMDDPDTLSENPQWDLDNWKSHLPTDDETIASTGHWMTAEKLYALHYRMSDQSHAHWNICNHLQDFLPSAQFA